MTGTSENPTRPDPSGIAARRLALENRFPRWESRSLGSWFEDLAAEFGDRPFVITDETTLSYTEVRDRAREWADGLFAEGVRPGDHVGLLVANYPEFVPLKLAVAMAGAVAVPLNFLYRAEELGYVLAQADIRLLVTMTGFAGLDHLGMLDAVAPGWDGATAGSLAGLPALRRVIQFSTDGRVRDGVPTIHDLAALGRGTAGATAHLHVPGDAPSDLLYTSGTTGLPKGVLVTHDAVLRTGYASALTRAFEDGRRILFSLPCYHMFGYVEGVLGAGMVGGAVVLQTAFTPGGYLRGVQDHHATDLLAVPTMAVAMVELPGKERYDLSSLRAILVGAAPGPVWLWERVAQELGASEIVTGYGMTETGGAMTMTRPEDPYELTSRTAGRVKSAGVAGIAEHGGDLIVYRTVDPLSGEFRPEGEIGELVASGPTTMLRYWRKPEETAAALRGGWVYSGDLGRVRPDGYLELVGRSKELYKSGGELISPKEIEDLLSTHPDISQAYAIGVPDERWGEMGVVCVVRTAEGRIDEAAVIALCKERLARFKVPKRVEFLSAVELPLTPTGKVQKFRLVELVRQRLASAAHEQTTVRMEHSDDDFAAVR